MRWESSRKNKLALSNEKLLGSTSPKLLTGSSQVLEEIEPALARAHQVEVAVTVDVDGGHLQAGAGRAGREVLEGQAVGPLRRCILGRLALEDHVLDPVLGARVKRIPGDERAVGRARLDLVGVDPLAGHQLVGLAVAVDVGPQERMNRGDRVVDRLLGPGPLAAGALALMQPEQSVVVAHAIDDVGQSIAIDVTRQDLDAGRAELPVRVPGPCAVGGIGRGLEPALGREQVDAAIAVDVPRADAVPGRLRAQVVLLEVETFAVALLDDLIPDDHVDRVGQNVRHAVARQVDHPGRLDVARHVDLVIGPGRAAFPGFSTQPTLLPK